MQRLIVLILGLFLTTLVSAEVVVTSLPGGLHARADFQAGEAGKPAVLLLHGFLQTHEFPTIARLASGLHDEGYTTLAPTLSLRISHRRQSLACEALHQHSLSDDLQELQHWLKWLKARHKGPVWAIGHSVGALELLAYIDRRLQPGIEKFIGVSIVEGRARTDTMDVTARIQSLRAKAGQAPGLPITIPFSYCTKYLSTPERLVSYLEWTPDRIIQATRKSKVPLIFIMGDRDERLGPDWVDKLGKTPAKLIIIQGANHFMDGEHEFELLDKVQNELTTH